MLQTFPPHVATHLFFLSSNFVKQDSANDLPYNFGPDNSWNVNSTYLSPYDWLYGAYAPPFWADNFDALALSEVWFSQSGAFCGAILSHVRIKCVFASLRLQGVLLLFPGASFAMYLVWVIARRCEAGLLSTISPKRQFSGHA